MAMKPVQPEFTTREIQKIEKERDILIQNNEKLLALLAKNFADQELLDKLKSYLIDIKNQPAPQPLTPIAEKSIKSYLLNQKLNATSQIKYYESKVIHKKNQNKYLRRKLKHLQFQKLKLQDKYAKTEVDLKNKNDILIAKEVLKNSKKIDVDNLKESLKTEKLILEKINQELSEIIETGVKSATLAASRDTKNGPNGQTTTKNYYENISKVLNSKADQFSQELNLLYQICNNQQIEKLQNLLKYLSEQNFNKNNKIAELNSNMSKLVKSLDLKYQMLNNLEKNLADNLKFEKENKLKYTSEQETKKNRLMNLENNCKMVKNLIEKSNHLGNLNVHACIQLESEVLAYELLMRGARRDMESLEFHVIRRASSTMSEIVWTKKKKRTSIVEPVDYENTFMNSVKIPEIRVEPSIVEGLRQVSRKSTKRSIHLARHSFLMKVFLEAAFIPRHSTTQNQNRLTTRSSPQNTNRRRFSYHTRNSITK